MILRCSVVVVSVHRLLVMMIFTLLLVKGLFGLQKLQRVTSDTIQIIHVAVAIILQYVLGRCNIKCSFQNHETFNFSLVYLSNLLLFSYYMSHVIIPVTPGYSIFRISQMLSFSVQAYISLSIIFPHKEILRTTNSFFYSSLQLLLDITVSSDL